MIAKLRGRSAAEFRDRLVQFGRAFAERHGVMPSVRVPAGLTGTPRTPWGPLHGDAVRALLPSAQRAAILTRAERIVDGRFDILGLSGISFGAPIDWQLDPVSGRRASLVHWSRIPYLDHDVVGDHKIVWELNRHQWLITLGQAWVLTGDPAFPEAAALRLREWLAANPPKAGMNWCSALERAFRVQSWIHALRLFAGAPSFDVGLQRDLVASAALQIDHVVRNLSTWFSPNTHLTGEALAMLCAGCAWPELAEAASWRSMGWAILRAELPRQVRDDGVYFEQSAWYQAYTLDFYVLAMQWAQLAGETVPPAFVARVRAAGLALRAVTRPDGTVVRLGDDDGGRTLPYAVLPLGDMTDSLWRAAATLGDGTLVPPTDDGRASLLWLEGAEAFGSAGEMAATPATRTSQAFRAGGWVSLVETGTTARRDHWLVLDAGPHGALSSAHSHADALSIELSVHGVPMLVDPGTGAYLGHSRTRYRGTAIHNTVTVDGADSSEQGGAFGWRTATDARLAGFGTATGATFVSASHDGYHRLADPVRHHRALLRVDRRYWLMFDSIIAGGSHGIALAFQGAGAVRIMQDSAHAFALCADDVQLNLVLDPTFTAEVEVRTISPAYGLECSAPAVVATTAIDGSTDFCTVLGSNEECGALTLERLSARTWRVTHRDGTDLVAHPGGTSVALGPARFDGDALLVLGDASAHTVVAAGAGTLHLAGAAQVLGADDIRVVRTAHDGTWTVES